MNATELFASLDQAIKSGGQAAVCRLVETRGSTPQKAGASMVVLTDGRLAGTLGGGCVEAEVRRRALASLASGKTVLARFQLDDDYGWDDGLICGGKMLVRIEPVAQDASLDYFRTLADVQTSVGGTEAVVVDGDRSALSAGALFLFDSGRRPIASHPRRDVVPPDDVVAALRPLSTRPRPWTSAGVAYLPVFVKCRLIIVGGGHVGQAVAELAIDLDFDVTVVDDREEFTSEERFPGATRRICGPLGEVLPQLDITPTTYCLIVTRGHRHDEQALYHLVGRGGCYLGMIGSRRKIKLIFEDLLGEGVSPVELAQVHAPVGLEIGSQTVAEIAVSIAAELVAHRNLGASPR